MMDMESGYVSLSLYNTLFFTSSAPEGGCCMMSVERGCVSQSRYNTLLFTIIEGTMGGNNHIRW